MNQIDCRLWWTTRIEVINRELRTNNNIYAFKPIYSDCQNDLTLTDECTVKASVNG